MDNCIHDIMNYAIDVDSKNTVEGVIIINLTTLRPTLIDLSTVISVVLDDSPIAISTDTINVMTRKLFVGILNVTIEFYGSVVKEHQLLNCLSDVLNTAGVSVRTLPKEVRVKLSNVRRKLMRFLSATFLFNNLGTLPVFPMGCLYTDSNKFIVLGEVDMDSTTPWVSFKIVTRDGETNEYRD